MFFHKCIYCPYIQSRVDESVMSERQLPSVYRRYNIAMYFVRPLPRLPDIQQECQYLINFLDVRWNGTYMLEPEWDETMELNSHHGRAYGNETSHITELA